MDKSHLFNIINAHLHHDLMTLQITSTTCHLYPDTSQSGYKSLICLVEKDCLSSLFELALFDDHSTSGEYIGFFLYSKFHIGRHFSLHEHDVLSI